MCIHLCIRFLFILLTSKQVRFFCNFLKVKISSFCEFAFVNRSHKCLCILAAQILYFLARLLRWNRQRQRRMRTNFNLYLLGVLYIYVYIFDLISVKYKTFFFSYISQHLSNSQRIRWYRIKYIQQFYSAQKIFSSPGQTQERFMRIKWVPISHQVSNAIAS